MKTIVALGNFDAIHVGHIKIINETVKIAKQNGAIPVLFTFDGDLSAYLGKSLGVAFTQNEKLIKIKKYGIEKVIFAPINDSFLSKTKEEFLTWLDEQVEVLGYVCGDDFSFGLKAEGNVLYLKEYAEKNGKILSVISEVLFNKERASTTKLKEYLKLGEMQLVTNLLGGEDYFISGTVVSGRGKGKTIGFPTVNLAFSNEKFPIKEGVYAGYTYIDDKKYKVVINYGNAPTFDFNDKVLEFFILDYSGDLYGKNLTVYFTKFLRKIKKFLNVDELKNQIEKDVNSL
ncbi:MAG: riboflavin biosynthesis protein RibF [Clostridia bacterium]|nr:riboflavin biosynthesis protein RibF [Clostridia bacterium]